MSSKFTLTTTIVFSAVALFLNSCKSYNVAARYDSKFINANSGKLSAQVPEAFELGYTMLALTDLAQNDTTIINKNTAYYQDLMAWFSKYKNQKGVQHLNASLKANPQLIRNYLEGLHAFQLNEGRVALSDHYRIDVNKFDFKRYGILLEHFYKASNFHSFYVKHADVYAGIVQKANGMYNFEKAQKNVNGNVKSYQVILSPLTKGYAGTMEIKGHTYSECIIFPRLTKDGMTYAANTADRKSAE